MPVGAPEVGEPSPLSGDVAPSADLTTAFCAGAATQLTKSAAMVRSTRGMDITCIARHALRRSDPLHTSETSPVAVTLVALKW
jgi:hypothetical protein